jgi:hypothetical protein
MHSLHVTLPRCTSSRPHTSICKEKKGKKKRKKKGKSRTASLTHPFLFALRANVERPVTLYQKQGRNGPNGKTQKITKKKQKKQKIKKIKTSKQHPHDDFFPS